MLDVLYKEKEEYTNNLNPIKSYLEQLTFFIMTKKNISYDEALIKAKEVLKKHFRDRPLKCFERIENGDRIVKDTTVYNYINDNLKEGNILTPTFTSYMSRAREKSMLSEFIFMAVSKRGVAKKEEHQAKADGNKVLATAKNNEQNLLKIYANSLSGAFAQEACIVHNPSNHSTLTSLTRTMTSLSNANNERIIAGNRYYPRPIDVYNNIVYICTYTDTAKIQEAILKYNLYLPTIEDTVKVLQRSSDLYFYDKQYYDKHIIPYLKQLDPYYLASICYTGDLYHLREFNSDFMKKFLTNFIKPIVSTETIPDVVNKLYKLDESMRFFVHHIFFKDLKGKGKDYERFYEGNEKLVESIYLTTLHVSNILLENKLFFNAFFMSPVLPCNSFRLSNMRRRTVVLSDTDSTCFTMDDWAKWYKGGEFIINDETISLAGCISYLASQAIVNLLRIISRNLNIDTELLGSLQMKNEFLWLTHVPAEVSKHYFAYTVLQEGSVLREEEIETKGVHLKNSAVPKFVLDHGKELMEEILINVSHNKKISLDKIIGDIIRLEDIIRESVGKGEPIFLKKSKIKNMDSYADGPERSPYGRHVFWQEVFSTKYGQVPEPPYSVIKIPTVVDSKTSLTEWLNKIADEGIKAKLVSWLERNNKKNLPTIYLNDQYVLGKGIPEEIMMVADINRIILDVTLQHRTILESLGVLLYKDVTVKDQFTGKRTSIH